MRILDSDTQLDNATFSDGQSIAITAAGDIEQSYEKYKDCLLTPEERKKYYLD